MSSDSTQCATSCVELSSEFDGIVRLLPRLVRHDLLPELCDEVNAISPSRVTLGMGGSQWSERPFLAGSKLWRMMAPPLVRSKAAEAMGVKIDYAEAWV